MDIREEKFRVGADLQFIVIVGVGALGRDENFNGICVVERVVAILIWGDDFVVDAFPSYEEVLCVVAEGGPGGGTWTAVDVGEGEGVSGFLIAVGNIKRGD